MKTFIERQVLAARIVIAEDSPTQAQKLCYLLEQNGFRTNIARDGKEALELLRVVRPQLLISDVVMPEMDGYALCKAVRTDSLLQDIPVMLVTTLADSGDVLRGLECGADNLIRKPYKDEDLLARIEQVLMNRALRKTVSRSSGVEMFVGGQRHVIHAERRQILDLLISTYEQAVRVNEELVAQEKQVTELNLRLAEQAETLQVTNLEIAQKNMELDCANRAKTEFLANMSHELRTPLNAIIGFSELLKDGMLGALSAEQRDVIGDIFTSGQHLLALINDVLDLSKVEAGKMTLQLEEVPIFELLQGSLVVVKERAAAHRITLTLEVAEDIDTIDADARKLKQIVFNLLSNAVKFTPDGGKILLQATNITQADASSLQVVVADTGVGIDEKDLSRLFQPFEQLESYLSKRAEGSGLGLALVKQLCELHGGTIRVESELGCGSRFIVELPYPKK